MVNSNTVNSKFHLIRSYCEIFFYHFPNISCLKCTVNSIFHLIRSKILLTNDFKLTVPNLYHKIELNQVFDLSTRCCDMGQNDTIGKIELFPLSSCQVIILIARMTFNCFSSCLMS